MASVKFYRGLEARYNSTTHANGIYFATDTQTIWLDGKQYGYTDITDLEEILNKSVKSVEFVVNTRNHPTGKTDSNKPTTDNTSIGHKAGTDSYVKVTLNDNTVVEAIVPRALGDGYTDPDGGNSDGCDGLMSADDQVKLQGIEAGAQVNKIEHIQVDGTEVTIGENKTVNIDLSGKADKADTYTKQEVDDKISDQVSTTYKYKGSKEQFSELPEADNKVGDVYNIASSFVIDGKTYPEGTNVAWTGTAWDALGGVFDTSSLSDAISELQEKVGNISDASTGNSAFAKINKNAEDIASLNTKVGDLETTVSEIDGYTVNGKAISTNPILNGNDISLTGYTTNVGSTTNILETDKVNDAIKKLDQQLLWIDVA